MCTRYSSVIQTKKKKRNSEYEHTLFIFNETGDIVSRQEYLTGTGKALDRLNCEDIGAHVLGERRYKIIEGDNW